MATLYSKIESLHQGVANRLSSGVTMSSGSNMELTEISLLCDKLKNNLISEDDFKSKILNSQIKRNALSPTHITFDDFLNKIGILCQ